MSYYLPWPTCTRPQQPGPPRHRRRACSTATTPRSTSCGGSCRARAARSSTSATTARVQEVVDAALEEDVQGVAVSSYQGGHVEYFEYLVESLRARGAGHVKVVGGGGGVIVPDEIDAAARVAASPSSPPRTASGWACVGMINSVVADCDIDLWAEHAGHRRRRCSPATGSPSPARSPAPRAAGSTDGDAAPSSRAAAARRVVPVLGITGTGGSGKSSLTDELVRRFRIDQQDKLRDRGDRRRPDPPQGRRRAARRPDPDELPRRRPGLLPLAGHPRRARGARAPRRRDRRAEGRRLRPGHRRDARHRPGRRRRSCRSSTTRST